MRRTDWGRQLHIPASEDDNLVRLLRPSHEFASRLGFVLLKLAHLAESFGFFPPLFPKQERRRRQQVVVFAEFVVRAVRRRIRVGVICPFVFVFFVLVVVCRIVRVAVRPGRVSSAARRALCTTATRVETDEDVSAVSSIAIATDCEPARLAAAQDASILHEIERREIDNVVLFDGQRPRPARSVAVALLPLLCCTRVPSPFFARVGEHSEVRVPPLNVLPSILQP